MTYISKQDHKKKQEEIFLYLFIFPALYFVVLKVETLPFMSTGVSKINKILKFLVVDLINH